jgi:hypothetical protein
MNSSKAGFNKAKGQINLQDNLPNQQRQHV